MLQFVDQFRGCGKAELRPRGEVGETDPVDADVAKDLEVRLSKVCVAMVGGRGKKLESKLAEQADEQLTDGQPARSS
ncbi:MAG: hypothetical protein NVSMB22_01650 [Chloroflexota bacterium]